MVLWPLELLGVVSSLLFTFLNAREKIISWFFGLVGALFYLYIFYFSKLYGDASLQLYYLGVSIYGWISWSQRGERETSNRIHVLEPRKLIGWLLLASALYPVAGWYLDRFTDSDVPYWDGFTTVFSFLATWMMTRKILQNWVIWWMVDVICIGLYVYKGLWLTAGLFVGYTALAVFGYLSWKKELKAEGHGQ